MRGISMPAGLGEQQVGQGAVGGEGWPQPLVAHPQADLALQHALKRVLAVEHLPHCAHSPSGESPFTASLCMAAWA